MSWDEEHGFSVQKLKLKDDYEGKVEATLIERRAEKKSDKAILYLHGFVDYFFQYHLADWTNELDINFYALDLRKHGRSILPHQKPNMAKSLSEYYEEIDIAIDIIRKKDKNDFLILMGHSTGGLISALYAHLHRNDNIINALILNSPFFDMNKPTWFKKIVIPIIAKIGKNLPMIPSPEGLQEGYAKSIHSDHFGDWDFNIDYKPIKGFKINLGWVSAIHSGQKKLQSGLDIKCPVLVLYSSKSVAPGKFHKSMHTADAVLNVKDISKYGDVIGTDVKKVEITGGVHDLVLSRKRVQDDVFREMNTFIEDITKNVVW